MTADPRQPIPLVSAQGLVKHFPLGERGLLNRREREFVHAVENVNLEIFPREVVGLIGESGSGKSTLGRCLLRLHQVTSGRVVFDGDDITTYEGAALRGLRRRMSLVFQDPHAAVNRRRRIGSIVAQPLIAQGIGSADERRRRVRELLGDIGVLQTIDRYPHELSGGQLQRVVIARALATQPDFIVADEPTASLDVSIRAQIINLLSDLKAELAITLLFISHDLRTVSHIADRVAVMYLGQLVEVGPALDVVQRPSHPYTAGLIASLPRLRRDDERQDKPARGEIPNPAHPPAGCRYHSRCPLAQERCRVESPQLELKGDGRMVACHFVPAQVA